MSAKIKGLFLVLLPFALSSCETIAPSGTPTSYAALQSAQLSESEKNDFSDELTYGAYWVPSRFSYSTDDVVSGFNEKTPIHGVIPLSSLNDANDVDVIIKVVMPGDSKIQFDVVSAYSRKTLFSGEVPFWGGVGGSCVHMGKLIIEAFAPGKNLYALVRKEKRRSIQALQTPSAQAGSLPLSAARPILAPKYQAEERPDDYAVIIGIENYADLPSATYAVRDASSMKNFVGALGVPERNIMLLTEGRATKTGIEKTLEAWLPNNVSEKSRVYVFYSGHGAPDVKTGDAYLVPSDGDPQYLSQTGYPLKRLYAKLGELKAKSVLAALDSCFSGAGGRSVLTRGTRPLVGKVNLADQAQGKVSVITASAGDQISGANDEAGYGLFTYNLLQGLNGAAKDAQGQVTLKSLYAYIKPRVQDDARRGNREQTPQIHSVGQDLILRAK